eukprot:scaffold30707_cov129-Isochrysis_galbana.AAC.1
MQLALHQVAVHTQFTPSHCTHPVQQAPCSTPATDLDRAATSPGPMASSATTASRMLVLPKGTLYCTAASASPSRPPRMTPPLPSSPPSRVLPVQRTPSLDAKHMPRCGTHTSFWRAFAAQLGDYFVEFDQCAFNTDVDGTRGPQKSTRIAGDERTIAALCRHIGPSASCDGVMDATDHAAVRRHPAVDSRSLPLWAYNLSLVLASLPQDTSLPYSRAPRV